MNNNYLIDSNIFITAHRLLYPFDIAPGFWEQLIEKASEKMIIIEKVNNEIVRGGDQLTRMLYRKQGQVQCFNYTRGPSDRSL